MKTQHIIGLGLVLGLVMSYWARALPIENALYGAMNQTDRLYRIDPATATKVLVGDTEVAFSGLAYVPEPASLGLLIIGGLALFRRRVR